jgi:hypothetical protein
VGDKQLSQQRQSSYGTIVKQLKTECCQSFGKSKHSPLSNA